MDEAKITCCGFVVSGCQPSGTFEFVEAAFNLVSQSINMSIKGNYLFAVSPSWNDRRTTLIDDVLANVIRIIAAIRNEHLGRGQFTIAKQVKALVVGNLTPGDLSPHGKAKGIGDQMYLGRKATF
jgi:hypothetical protein